MADGKDWNSDGTSSSGYPIFTPPTTVAGDAGEKLREVQGYTDHEITSGGSADTSVPQVHHLPAVRHVHHLPAVERIWSSHGEIPWPGNTYHIIEKVSGNAITSIGTTPALVKLKDSHDPCNVWYCVEKNGYYGFQNPSSGRFLGHDGHSGMRTGAWKLDEWELWTPRQHPEGGYQLLSPFWSHTLMSLCAAEDGKSLARRTHGTTLWEFVLV